MPFPLPWSLIEDGIRRQQDYAVGSQKLAEFFKATEEKVSPENLFRLLIDSKPNPKWMERFAFCLLDVGASDKTTGLRALEGHRIKNLLRRKMVGSKLDEEESNIAQPILDFLVENNQSFEAWKDATHHILERLLLHETVPDLELKSLAFFMHSEAEALKLRVHWLSENADPYNMKTMARILPRLRVYDEMIDNTHTLSEAIGAGKPIGENHLSLEAHFKSQAFDKWLGKCRPAAALRPWVLALELQRSKRIPSMDLIAMSTLARYVYEVRGEKLDPIAWITLALRSWNEGLFSLDAGQAAITLKPTLISLGLKVNDSRIEGNFNSKNFVALIGKDLMTRSYSQLENEGALDMKSLILQNMGRDSVLESLLNNAKVYQSPGLVAYIVSTCRSAAVLSKIAKTRHLYSGYANRDVPLALIQSPANIPLNLLRPFIHTRYISMVDLRHIARARSGIRNEVHKEVEEYLSNNG